MFIHSGDRRTMRCRQARKKLTEFVNGSLESSEQEALCLHLDGCPRCAQIAAVDQLLSRDLEQIQRADPTGDVTVAQVRQRIADREESENKMNAGEKIMRRINETAHRRPRLSIASAVMSILLLASILVPVTTKQSTEYGITFAAPAGGMILNEQDALKLLDALNLDKARVEVNKSPAGTEYKIAPLADTAQVQRLVQVLDSLGGSGSHRVLATKLPGEKRTVWELLLENKDGSVWSPGKDTSGLYIAVDDLGDLSKSDYVLWLPAEERQDDSAAGILIDREGEKTGIWMPGIEPERDNRGWNPLLHGNTEMKIRTPEGHLVDFDLTNVIDVRKLEKMGYNFWLMKFETPGRIPIPDMAPQLNKIDSDNPDTDGIVISYMIPQASKVQIRILDENRREVCTLLDDIVITGIHSVLWNGFDAKGKRVEPGDYLCRFKVGDYMETRKIALGR